MAAARSPTHMIAYRRNGNSLALVPYVEYNLDRDGDVDQTDFGCYRRCFSAAGNPADPNCAN